MLRAFHVEVTRLIRGLGQSGNLAYLEDSGCPDEETVAQTARRLTGLRLFVDGRAINANPSTGGACAASFPR